MILVGIVVTLLVSWGLSRTILRGAPSAFTLELPPYRNPQLGQVIVRSIYDRTMHVLMRAVKVAAPAGAIVWILANIDVGNLSLLGQLANPLDPFARMIGLDGINLTAFILGLPANEIVLPIMIMGYLAEGAILELDSLAALQSELVDSGWTLMTALSVMLFSLLQWKKVTQQSLVLIRSGWLGDAPLSLHPLLSTGQEPAALLERLNHLGIEQ